MKGNCLIRSPIDGGLDVSLVRMIDCLTLISEYGSVFDIDISGYVGENKAIGLYKCNTSGVFFYFPANIVGDSDFYHRLEKNNWYYMPSKWEFEESINHITGGAILEIGAARGDFLDTVRRAYPDSELVGLELNQDAAKEANKRGLDVRIELSGDHAKSNKARYDVVASFQVLEHIPAPMALLKDAIEMLKPGGKLIIGVPDNSLRASPSLFVTAENILNMPPHHQGLWSISSLSYLTKVLPLRLEYVATEPATAIQHSNSYRGLMKRDLMRRFGRYLGFVIYMIGRPFYNHSLRQLNKYLPAHSILAVFVKTI